MFAGFTDQQTSFRRGSSWHLQKGPGKGGWGDSQLEPKFGPLLPKAKGKIKGLRFCKGELHPESYQKYILFTCLCSLRSKGTRYLLDSIALWSGVGLSKFLDPPVDFKKKTQQPLKIIRLQTGTFQLQYVLYLRKYIALYRRFRFKIGA